MRQFRAATQIGQQATQQFMVQTFRQPLRATLSVTRLQPKEKPRGRMTDALASAADNRFAAANNCRFRGQVPGRLTDRMRCRLTNYTSSEYPTADEQPDRDRGPRHGHGMIESFQVTHNLYVVRLPRIELFTKKSAVIFVDCRQEAMGILDPLQQLAPRLPADELLQTRAQDFIADLAETR
jgi:hypothetical protein